MKAGPIVVTVDLDWACEAAIVDVLDWLRAAAIPTTVFITHRSAIVTERLGELEVGLHPYFAPDSSHGDSLAAVTRHVLTLPHNLRAFRCHRFVVSNEIREVMAEAGMTVSSNVCTDLESVAPFRDRFGLLEVPIFLEDGGYLFRRRPLDGAPAVTDLLDRPGPKVVVIHPMHFAVNTPRFEYMVEIKRSVSRTAWHAMTAGDLESLRWHETGVRDFLCELIMAARDREREFITLGELARLHHVADPRSARGGSTVNTVELGVVAAELRPQDE